MVKKIILLGAGGRDFHNFNVLFRDNDEYHVVAFVVTQIPGIEYRRYPPSLAGRNYPNGIPIYPEEMLEELIRKYKVDEVVLSYSDLTYEELGRKISEILIKGVSFKLLNPYETMLETIKPVIAVTATKTGAGKSTISRAISLELKRRGINFVVVRHPMAYKDLEKNVVEIYRTMEDLDRYGVTLEEREEFEHYVRNGIVVMAGIDYGKILLEAEKRGDIILWDGGNNDLPFYRPWFMIVATDALRPGNEIGTYPGEVNIRLADIVIITKVSQAKREHVESIINNIQKVNRKAEIVRADLEVFVDRPDLVKGRRALVIEDAPTVTHGGLPYAAGYVAAIKYGAEIIDPRPYAKGVIKKIYEEYKNMGPVLPSIGYTHKQLEDLKDTINSIDCDVIILGTPINLDQIIKINKPVVHTFYELKIVEGPSIKEIVDMFLEKVNKNYSYQQG
ncbi:conserved hypothetical protein [Ignisphaera aggregans DSM 17230]|uniref:GTPase n=1 Tax=Ignisphaera aggregans (strain DSM 17230 / JCM 13409 / AQ1.S1) TaxID=583356 RepID=E0SP73_IGNAA|nr:conserved hypothetical protein [Ignisphaera aggregans DSM 17230]